MTAAAELAGWTTITDLQLARMVEGFDDPGRLATHPWAITLASGSRHLPDLVLRHPLVDRPVAVEVELSRKAPERLRAILDGYALDRERYGQVWYLTASDGLAEHVRRGTLRLAPPLSTLTTIVHAAWWTLPPVFPAPPTLMVAPPASAAVRVPGLPTPI